MFDLRALQEYSKHLTGLLRALPPPTTKGSGQQRIDPYVANVTAVKNFDPSGADAVVATIKLKSCKNHVSNVLS